MREGSLDAPVRHVLDWKNPEFYDPDKIDEALRHAFDICHGCRRCFNLCDSFPRLFDLIDDSETGELDSVDSKDFKPVVDACTLCDMCFMVKCPYVPPHEFDLDFPHLMLRVRAAEFKKGEEPGFTVKQLAQMDRNGKLAGAVSGLANWGSDKGNGMTRPLLEKTIGIDAKAELPKFHGKTFMMRSRDEVPAVNTDAPAHGRKAAIYATCNVNYNNPDVGMAARAVLAKNGIASEVVYPSCCGMPFLEHGNLEKVAEQAVKVSAELRPWIDKGYDIITLTASCGLMMKFEWPLIVPDDENVKALAQAVADIDEYVVDIAKNEGLVDGLTPVDGGVTVHLACHARAQNQGPKAAEMLRMIPETKVDVIERCAGHGGTFGVMKETHEVALKVGKPVARNALKQAHPHVVSDCPLAGKHILQGMESLDAEAPIPSDLRHPIQVLALSYNL